MVEPVIPDNTITTPVRVSGSCGKCGQINVADIPVTGMPGATVIATATISCGAPSCDATFSVSGQGVLR